MKLYRGLHNLVTQIQRTVVSVGNFDGVHLGHQQLFRQMRDIAQQHNLVTTVVIFEPQPKEYFAPNDMPARLTCLREKLALLESFGIEQVLCLHFTEAMAQMPPIEFIETVLVRGLSASHIVVGEDFRYGRHRQGDFTLLVAQAARFRYVVSRFEPYILAGERVSSSRVREALAEGNFALAKQLLGRPYAITGRVRHGAEVGRQLGYPTANITTYRHELALHGVAVVKVLGLGSQIYYGVVNIGVRPTVHTHASILQCEVYVLDYSNDAYGAMLTIEFLVKLREEQRFSGITQLQQQITADVANARDFLKDYCALDAKK